MINGKVAKAGTEVKIGDVIEIQFGTNNLKAEILEISENARKEAASLMYRIL